MALAVTFRLAEIEDSFCARRSYESERSSGVAEGGRARGQGVYWGYACRARGRYGVVAVRGGVVSAISAVAVVVAVAPVGIDSVGGGEGV